MKRTRWQGGLRPAALRVPAPRQRSGHPEQRRSEISPFQCTCARSRDIGVCVACTAPVFSDTGAIFAVGPSVRSIDVSACTLSSLMLLPSPPFAATMRPFACQPPAASTALDHSSSIRAAGDSLGTVTSSRFPRGRWTSCSSLSPAPATPVDSGARRSGVTGHRDWRQQGRPGHSRTARGARQSARSRTPNRDARGDELSLRGAGRAAGADGSVPCGRVASAAWTRARGPWRRR